MISIYYDYERDVIFTIFRDSGVCWIDEGFGLYSTKRSFVEVVEDSIKLDRL